MKWIRFIATGVFIASTFAAFAQPTTPPVNVWAWGDKTSLLVSEMPKDLTNAISVSLGEGPIGLAARADGTVVAWGSFPQVPAELTNALAVAAGANHCVALRSDGTVLHWGQKDYQGCDVCDVPPGLSNVVAIAVGHGHNLALRIDGSVVAWGRNGDYECDVPPSLTNAVAVAAGGYASLALRDDGTVVAWGNNVGHRNEVPPGLSNVVAIAAGYQHNLAVRADGNVVAWGDNNMGECDVPSNATNVVAVDAGHYHSLALRADGTVVAWGWNADGQCDVPLDLPRALAVSAGGSSNMALVDPTQAGAPPTILVQPRSQTVAIGSTVYFSVGTIASGLLRFQWYFDGNLIPEATTRVLSIPSAQTFHSGAYSVTVSNAAGDTVSVPAMLSVLPGLTVTMVPAISLAGTVGLSYRIEYVNAVGPVGDWKELATVTVTNTGQFYFDVSAIGQPLRFYRLVELP